MNSLAKNLTISFQDEIMMRSLSAKDTDKLGTGKLYDKPSPKEA
jgi:hypothetical protein